MVFDLHQLMGRLGTRWRSLLPASFAPAAYMLFLLIEACYYSIIYSVHVDAQHFITAHERISACWTYLTLQCFEIL